jgi:hypothetical protein
VNDIGLLIDEPGVSDVDWVVGLTAVLGAKIDDSQRRRLIEELLADATVSAVDGDGRWCRY